MHALASSWRAYYRKILDVLSTCYRRFIAYRNETFDRKVVQLLSEQPNTLLAISETDLREAQETGLRSLAVLWV